MGQVVKFPSKESSNPAKNSFITMTLRRNKNGMSCLTNLNNLSKEELLETLLSDAIMEEKQNLAKKYIAQ